MLFKYCLVNVYLILFSQMNLIFFNQIHFYCWHVLSVKALYPVSGQIFLLDKSFRICKTGVQIPCFSLYGFVNRLARATEGFYDCWNQSKNCKSCEEGNALKLFMEERVHEGFTFSAFTIFAYAVSTNHSGFKISGLIILYSICDDFESL